MAPVAEPARVPVATSGPGDLAAAQVTRAVRVRSEQVVAQRRVRAVAAAARKQTLAPNPMEERRWMIPDPATPMEPKVTVRR
jgi:hypothetical protein